MYVCVRQTMAVTFYSDSRQNLRLTNINDGIRTLLMRAAFEWATDLNSATSKRACGCPFQSAPTPSNAEMPTAVISRSPPSVPGPIQCGFCLSALVAALHRGDSHRYLPLSELWKYTNECQPKLSLLFTNSVSCRLVVRPTQQTHTAPNSQHVFNECKLLKCGHIVEIPPAIGKHR